MEAGLSRVVYLALGLGAGAVLGVVVYRRQVTQHWCCDLVYQGAIDKVKGYFQ